MTDLDEMFKAARAAEPGPSAHLLARVMADAARVQAERAAPVHRPGAAKPGFGAWLVEVFGGAGALAGVLTAGIAGLALGYVQPASLSQLTAMLTPAATMTESMELMPGLETLLTEE